MPKHDGTTDAADKQQKQQRSTRQQSMANATVANVDNGGSGLAEANASWPVDVSALASEITKKVAEMMDVKLSTLSSKFDSFVAKYEQDAKRLTEAENRISTAEDHVTQMEERLADAEFNVAALRNRLNMQEARSRRDNLRVFNIKERSEGSNAVAFFETWLPKVLDIEAKNGRIRLDRCHRGLGRSQTGSPRVVVMKLHNPTDKMRILTAFNKKKGLEYEGAKITIRQDLPHDILESRREFNAVCQHLIKKKIKFKMRFPSTLCFTYNNQDHACTNAEDAKEVLESQPHGVELSEDRSDDAQEQDSAE